MRLLFRLVKFFLAPLLIPLLVLVLVCGVALYFFRDWIYSAVSRYEQAREVAQVVSVFTGGDSSAPDPAATVQKILNAVATITEQSRSGEYYEENGDREYTQYSGDDAESYEPSAKEVGVVQLSEFDTSPLGRLASDAWDAADGER